HRDSGSRDHRHRERLAYVSEDAVEAHLDALLSASAPTRAEVEAALTQGHAAALELEADRVRIHRRLDRARSALDPRFDPIVATMAEELRGVSGRLHSLRGRLSEVTRRSGVGARLSDRAG